MIIYLATAILDLAICFYVLFSNAKASKATALLSLSLGLWSTELFLLSYINDTDQLSLAFHLTRWGLFFVPPACAFSIYKLSKNRNNFFLISTVLPCLLTSLSLCIANTLFFPSELKTVEGGFLPKKDTIYYIFLFEIIFATLATTIYSITRLKLTKIREKQTIIWRGMIIIFVFGSGIALSIVFVKFEYSYLSNFFGAFANLIYIMAILYITNTKSFVDIKKFISVAISHTLALAFIFSTYFYLTNEVANIDNPLLYIVTSISILSPFFILYSRITTKTIQITSKFFSKNSYNKDLEIVSINKNLGESTSINEITETLNNLFLKTINAKKVEFYRVNNKTNAAPINSKNVIDITPNNDPCIRQASKNKKIFFSDEVPEDVRSYMEKFEISVVIPIPKGDLLSSIIYVGKPIFSRFYIGQDIAIFEWLQDTLPKVIDRIENLNKLKNELNDSRKTLSMLEVMNQYHHDIKTPLAVIDGIVSTDIYDKDIQRDIVMEQVSKGTKLIATMTGILRGNRNRKIEDILLQDSISACLFLFENRFEKISTHFNNIATILGDDIDLKILFSNLLKNASEAADPKRALTLSVKTWEDQQYVYISITDSGTGMNAETVNNLWHLEKSEKETGSAIGLQAVKRIAEEHDAHISVTSTPGFGTCFELRFPISKE